MHTDHFHLHKIQRNSWRSDDDDIDDDNDFDYDDDDISYINTIAVRPIALQGVIFHMETLESECNTFTYIKKVHLHAHGLQLASNKQAAFFETI